MFGLDVPEIVVIVVAFAVLFFGGEKISEFARALGRFTGEFKKGQLEIKEEIEKLREGDTKKK